VVVARVNQFEADHRCAEELLHLQVRTGDGAEAVAGEHQLTDDDEVALALVDVRGFPHLGELAPGGGLLQPSQVHRTLPLALRVLETRAECLARQQQFGTCPPGSSANAPAATPPVLASSNPNGTGSIHFAAARFDPAIEPIVLDGKVSSPRFCTASTATTTGP
jgi:hypothetical protein